MCMVGTTGGARCARAPTPCPPTQGETDDVTKSSNGSRLCGGRGGGVGVCGGQSGGWGVDQGWQAWGGDALRTHSHLKPCPHIRSSHGRHIDEFTYMLEAAKGSNMPKRESAILLAWLGGVGLAVWCVFVFVGCMSQWMVCVAGMCCVRPDRLESSAVFERPHHKKAPSVPPRPCSRGTATLLTLLARALAASTRGAVQGALG